MNNHQVIDSQNNLLASDDVVFTNANLVLGHEIVKGSLRVENGLIADIDTSGVISAGNSIDCEGDYLSPGLVELHTDNLERHLQPRPGAHWPPYAAISSHDAELASVGITTVFDALRVGSLPSEGKRGGYKKYAREVATNISFMRNQNMLRINHLLHLRAEICSETLLEEIEEFDQNDQVGIVSLMDHTPGQRQFRDTEKLAEYLRGKHSMTDDEIEAHFGRLRKLQQENGEKHNKAAAEMGRNLGAILASHDDTTQSDVVESVKIGVGVAEFPTTLEAARECNASRIGVMMGAPNLLRGGSHSGNVAAHELVEHDLLDIFSSDYAPSSLLAACVRLGLESGNMANGLAKATAAPAKAASLDDRGVLEVGKRADLLRFGLIESLPLTRGLWVGGVRVA
ncbi:alpha-D-ribose 1-methylphosphonate 5-triphosphate diphosphatase [Lentilitoribacter sp. Alg239-R112]|jgi:alpha-D-ribose 1-methylphosphonate 5-triphosphate diphosphatase|uniref:alpha-D-ribose 1-methylphosphonate 5-triphosphate diphosphatase n=1 Tax=Lentilitoribacter sp. Alg239-R112 TaxID=2305987 RepID=UPI0013A70770|nr:alpha-D-ribose 1-methylphosphonate 5-triphosphate diphosphatase [Lentilitoribacter sp. Alg239-R112]